MLHDLNYHGPVVILDLDDTLYPERDYVRSGYKAIARSLQRRDSIDPACSFEVMNRAFELNKNPFDNLLNAFPGISHPDSLIPMCVSVYRYHSPTLSLPSESREFLEALRNKGVRTALVTDGRAVTQWAKIRALGIEEFFNPQDIWISEERGVGKSAIDPWRAIASHYPEAARFITIGDNPAKDFFYPNMLGFTTVCLRDRGQNIHSQTEVPSHLHKPGLLINSLTEALSIID
ncbi:MAG: HAD family hydrolase [Muribaculaceae bacterium]|nr:HAD family hydrolase [Muribaculaceae bacterium]